MSALLDSLDAYLETRRALGFKLKDDERHLRQFIAAIERAGEDRITLEACLAWASEPEQADPQWWAARLASVRCFARWHKAFDPATEVPPPDVWPQKSQRAEPYPYSEADILALIGAAGRLRSPLRAGTYKTLIGLLTVTGMRVGEAIGLDRGDLDEQGGFLVVRNGKFGKSRQLVLHETTILALGSYRRLRDEHCPSPVDPAFFLSGNGTRLIYKNVHFVFHRLVTEVGLAPLGPRCRPRVHDLRHRFAIETLIRWYRQDSDIESRMHLLSAYLGHLSPSDTYWYLRTTPELMAAVIERLEAREDKAR